nr:hypothetical protein [Tanacetum cinerariifolium]
MKLLFSKMPLSTYKRFFKRSMHFTMNLKQPSSSPSLTPRSNYQYGGWCHQMQETKERKEEVAEGGWTVVTRAIVRKKTINGRNLVHRSGCL